MCVTACLLLSAVLTEANAEDRRAGYCKNYCQYRTGGACVYCRRPTFGKRARSSSEIFPEVEQTTNLFREGLTGLTSEDKCILTTTLLEEMSRESRQRVIETIFNAVNEK